MFEKNRKIMNSLIIIEEFLIYEFSSIIIEERLKLVHLSIMLEERWLVHD